MWLRSRNKPGAIRALVDRLRRTPLHPQWYAFLREDAFLREVCAGLDGIVVDIGCADGKPQRHLPDAATYVGIDHLVTASEWYETRPDIYADAQALPLQRESVDHVLLLDVLEHLPEPGVCLQEVHRVLRIGGTFTIQVPFLYPIHDAPLDFHRWTRHGLQNAAERHGFEIRTTQAVGHPAETAALLGNIAMSKTILNWLAGRNPLALLAVLLPFAVMASNCAAWIVARLSRPDGMMPYAYRLSLSKA